MAPRVACAPPVTYARLLLLPQQEDDFEASEVQLEDLPSLVHALLLQVLDYLEPPVTTRPRAAKEPHLEAVLLLLWEYAKLGPVQRAHLVLCDAHHVLGEFAVQRLSSYSPPRLDNTGQIGMAVHMMLALILRGAVRARRLRLTPRAWG